MLYLAALVPAAFTLIVFPPSRRPGSARIRPDRVVQTLSNILGNAIKFSDVGQAVTVAARPCEAMVEFAVQDHGRSVPTDKLDHIFERFEQVDSSDSLDLGGTGLELTTSRDIVLLHGGRIGAVIEPGHGSTFLFTLPVPHQRPRLGHLIQHEELNDPKESRMTSSLLSPIPSGAPAVPAEFVTFDERFVGTGGDSTLRRPFTDGRWLEGPAYHAAGRFLLFSDIPNDRVLRYDEVGGRTDVFADPAGFANGRTVDRQGRFVSCEHGGRRVTRIEHDGSTTVLADTHDGHRLNSPNDVVITADGAVWFTDPSYGIRSDYEGHQAEEEIGSRNVYRLAPDGTLTVVADDFTQPNGLAFTADETRLVIVDSEEHHLRVFDVDGARLSGGAVLAADPNGYDGIRFDSEGRLWCAAQDGLHCRGEDGTLLGALRVPEVTSNLVFGGLQRNHLYLTASTTLYTLRVNFTGAVYAG